MISGTTIVCGAGQSEVRFHYKKGFLLATTACQLFNHMILHVCVCCTDYIAPIVAAIIT